MSNTQDEWDEQIALNRSVNWRSAQATNEG